MHEGIGSIGSRGAATDAVAESPASKSPVASKRSWIALFLLLSIAACEDWCPDPPDGGGTTVVDETCVTDTPDLLLPPRLDRISIKSATFTNNGKVHVSLYVQGANADEDAAVLVDGIVRPTVPHKLLSNDLLGVNRDSLAYPIAGHRSFVVSLPLYDVAQKIDVMIRNSDNQESNQREYFLPESPATLDSDGDDLPDTWEINGYDSNSDGTVDVDLPGLGADPGRIDVFLELDLMEGLWYYPHAYSLDGVVKSFDAAPIINPDGDAGISLHIDTSTDLVPYVFALDLTIGNTEQEGNFYGYKDVYFDNDGRIFHYCIWAHRQGNNTSSGFSDLANNGVIVTGPGDDCIVSLNHFEYWYQTTKIQAEVLAHELGHNLQLSHGGGIRNDFYNPTHNSVMSYSWAMRTGHSAWTRVTRPIYYPFYYGMAGAVEISGTVPSGIGTFVDYSDGMGRKLDEQHLNEVEGLFNNIHVNWDGYGGIVCDTKADINENGSYFDKFEDFPSWAWLVFSGPRRNGQYDDDDW